MNPNVAKFNKNQLLSDLYTHKDEKDFHTTFDKTITLKTVVRYAPQTFLYNLFLTY